MTWPSLIWLSHELGRMSLWAQPALNRLEPMGWFVVPFEDGAKAAACRLGADRYRRCLFDLSAGALRPTERRINPATRVPIEK